MKEKNKRKEKCLSTKKDDLDSWAGGKKKKKRGVTQTWREKKRKQNELKSTIKRVRKIKNELKSWKADTRKENTLKKNKA